MLLRKALLPLLFSFTAFTLSAQTVKPSDAAAVAPPASAQKRDSKQLVAEGPAKRVRSFDYKTLARKSRVFPDLATTKPPLRSSQKFRLFISESISPAAFGAATFGAGLGMARDNLPGYGQGMEGYGKRFGASLATGSSTQFFGTFLLASICHQDPRIFVRGDGSIRQSIKFGLRRLVLAPTDAGGEAINWSGLAGPLASQALANTYLPDDERTAGRTFQRYGTYLAMRAGVNALKEFWPAIFKRLKERQRPSAPAPSQPAEQRNPSSPGDRR